jgi:hypothetical protein
MTNINDVIDYVESWRANNGIAENIDLIEAQMEQFARDLQYKIDEFNFESPKPGATVIAYNGGMYGTEIPAWQFADVASNSSNGTLVYISDFEAGKLLNNQDFKFAVQQAVGEDLAKNILHGTFDVDGNRTPYSVNGVLSLDDYVSKQIMLQAEGNVVTFTTELKDHSVFTQTELQTILDNPKVTSINGIAKEELTSILNNTKYGFTYSQRMDLVREAIAIQSRVDLSTVAYASDADGKIIWTDAAKLAGGSSIEMPTGAGISKYSCAALIEMSKTDLESSSLRLTYVQGKFNFAEGLNKLGWAAFVVSTAYDAYQYKEAYDAGDTVKCKQILGDWLIEAGGSAVGGTAGWLATARTLAILTTIGVEAGAAGAFIVGALGAYIGYKAGEFVMDELRALFQEAEGIRSPLIIDLDGDGVETISLANGTHFDHDVNGFAEQTGWVGQDDGLLVRDINGNGFIDNGSELFGNNTLLNNGEKAANGFAALAELDENHDGKIDNSDAAYSQLRVWKDTDGDGVTDAGELMSLGDAGVASIATGYNESMVTDAQGNQHLQNGTYIKADGTTASVDDVWFKADLMHTKATEILEETPEIAGLPDLQGFGNVYSLHQAMLRDSSGHLHNLLNAS